MNLYVNFWVWEQITRIPTISYGKNMFSSRTDQCSITILERIVFDSRGTTVLRTCFA